MTHKIKEPGKKEVRFAEELDISPAPQKAAVAAVPENGNQQPTLEDSVFERGSLTRDPPKPEPPKTRKGSGFKSSHASSSLTTKQSPNSSTLQSVNDGGSLANGPLSEGVIERRVPGTEPPLRLIPAAAKSSHQFSHPIVLPEVPGVAPRYPPADCSTELSDPDGLDPALLSQEVAMKYHHMRNRMIQREGGFMPREEELERVPLTEEEGGSGKKVSRFKAARLGKRLGP
jgi:unconventional prefoldin RPB5 interactor 1